MPETYVRDLIGVLCLRPVNLSSWGFTRADVLDMPLDDALHYYGMMDDRWRREVAALKKANRRRS